MSTASTRLAAACVAVMTTAACASGTTTSTDGTSRAAATSSPSTPLSPAPSATTGTATMTRDVAMTRPGKLTKPTVSPDLLVYSGNSLPASTVAGVRKVKGVTDVNTFSMATFFHEERQVTYAAVDPATFRRYTPAGSAQTLAVWDRVADGEMAIDPALGRKLADKSGYVKMGNDDGSPKVHIGAYAGLVKRFGGSSVIDAVVNEKWAPRLGMKQGNAMLVSTGAASPQRIQQKLRKITGKNTSVQIVAVNVDIHTTQTAVLTGGSVSDALGTLNYTANRNGTVNPDPAWVSSFIRSESVPIIGRVTCNKVMLPELRGALSEVVADGLAASIHPSEYGGCFVPRFIANTQSLSFHTFGTAIDLNVPGNERGTIGTIDRQVVAIFEKWGFQWGGVWHYTDPMHFELHQIVRPK
ncbi:MAG: M15 family metallopeptidase [Marmoricola sp.]